MYFFLVFPGIVFSNGSSSHLISLCNIFSCHMCTASFLLSVVPSYLLGEQYVILHMSIR
jgi:hypothetical protein